MRLVRKLIKLLAWVMVIILILVVGILVFIQTPLAKRMIGEVIARVTRTSDGGEVRFREITGLIPYHIRVGDFRLRDGAGDWLVVKDADVRVSLPDLLHFRLRALDVRVKSASLLRLPQKNTTPREDDDTPFTLRSLPAFSADLLSVAHATIEESVLGERITADLKGYLIRSSPTNGGAASILLNRIDGKSGRLTLSAASGPEFSPLFTHILLEEGEGGSVEKLISPDSPGSFFLLLRGEGPINKWVVNLIARDQEQGEIKGDLSFDLPRPRAEGTLEVSLASIPIKGINGSGSLSARFSVQSEGQNISARIQAKDLKVPIGQAGNLEILMDLRDLFRSPRGTIGFNISDLRYHNEGNIKSGDRVEMGKLSGELSFQGADQPPEANLEIRVGNCVFPVLPATSLNPLDITITGELKDNRCHLSIDSGEQSKFSLKAEADAPVRIAFNPITIDLPEDGTISGQLQARVDLELLSYSLAISRQTVQGIVNAELTATGTIGKPELTGRIDLQKGRYRNLTTGSALNGVTMDLRADRDQITIKQLTATTPGHGKLEITGGLKLAPSEDFPYSFSLELNSAELTDLEELTMVCSGKLLLDGSLEKGNLQGTVKIDRAEGRIPRTFPPRVPEIEVEEINKPGGVPPGKKPSGPSPFLGKINLDLQIKATDNLTVKGRGLDSEWKADILVKGTAVQPLVSGGVYLIDGIFIFMGEALEMKDCSITMDGRFPPIPQLKINMEEVKSDITINLQVVGPITAPEVILSSQPPYPTDEIMARLLYGRSASQLSGLQALQIANGLRTLQGKGGIFDLLTGWTSFLGDIQVDLTELEGSSGQTAVRVRWRDRKSVV